MNRRTSSASVQQGKAPIHARSMSGTGGGDLAKQVEPACDPRHERRVAFRRKHSGPEVRAAARRMCATDLWSYIQHRNAVEKLVYVPAIARPTIIVKNAARNQYEIRGALGARDTHRLPPSPTP